MKRGITYESYDTSENELAIKQLQTSEWSDGKHRFHYYRLQSEPGDDGSHPWSEHQEEILHQDILHHSGDRRQV